jgi:hypothetical protein
MEGNVALEIDKELDSRKISCKILCFLLQKIHQIKFLKWAFALEQRDI